MSAVILEGDTTSDWSAWNAASAVFSVVGTWGGATAKLQWTPDDGTSVFDVAGASFSADSVVDGIAIGEGYIRVHVSGATGTTDLTARIGKSAPAGNSVGSGGATETTLQAVLAALESDESAIIGAVNEPVPTTDTASSGLNGRLQRIAQHLQPRLVDVTLTIETTALDAGDVAADTQVVTGATKAADTFGVLQSLAFVDPEDQKAACTFYFFSANVSLGTEDSAPSISDANALNYLGHVDVAVGDYKDLGGVSVAMPNFKPFAVKPATGTANIYVAMTVVATPTYAGGAATLRLGFL